MYFFFQILHYSVYNVLSVLKSPLFWVVVGILFLQYRKTAKMEKEILGTNKLSPL